MGEYKSGGDPGTDEAVQKFPALCEYLRQDERTLESASDSQVRMRTVLR